MAKKKETGLQRRIKKALRKEVGGWWKKMWGNPIQGAGLPDLIGCCCSIFFGLEVKVPKKGRTSEIQKETMAEIWEEGGGYCSVVTSPKEAVDFVRGVLVKKFKVPRPTKTLAKGRREVRVLKKVERAPLQAKAREDLHRLRRH